MAPRRQLPQSGVAPPRDIASGAGQHEAREEYSAHANLRWHLQSKPPERRTRMRREWGPGGKSGRQERGARARMRLANDLASKCGADCRRSLEDPELPGRARLCAEKPPSSAAAARRAPRPARRGAPRSTTHARAGARTSPVVAPACGGLKSEGGRGERSHGPASTPHHRPLREEAARARDAHRGPLVDAAFAALG